MVLYQIYSRSTTQDLYLQASWPLPIDEEKTLEELEIKNDESLCADLILIENHTGFSISPANVPDLSGLNLE